MAEVGSVASVTIPKICFHWRLTSERQGRHLRRVQPNKRMQVTALQL